MNLIEVRGGTEFQKDIAHKVTSHLVRKFFPRHKTLMIEINIKNLKGEASGWCLADDSRTFEIEVEKKQQLRDFIETICHEMVHVRQYVRNEVDLQWSKNPRWKNRRIGENVKYLDLPWEKEAYRLQGKLLKEIWDSNIL